MEEQVQLLLTSQFVIRNIKCKGLAKEEHGENRHCWFGSNS